MGFDFINPSTSQASPNDSGIVIVIIVVDEARLAFHSGGIIAQTRLREVSGWKTPLKLDQAGAGNEAQLSDRLCVLWGSPLVRKMQGQTVEIAFLCFAVVVY